VLMLGSSEGEGLTRTWQRWCAGARFSSTFPAHPLLLVSSRLSLSLLSDDTFYSTMTIFPAHPLSVRHNFLQKHSIKYDIIR
jgi:hypothetical protein